MTYEQCSVIVTPFPFTDKKGSKRRPVLVISDRKQQAHTGHVSVLMITTAKHSHWYGDWEIQNLEIAGLSVPSVIRQKIFTIDLRLVVKQIGYLAPGDQWQIVKSFEQHFHGFVNRKKSEYTIHEPSANYVSK